MEQTHNDNYTAPRELNPESLIPGSGHTHRHHRWFFSLAILALVVTFVGYGLYRYQIRPAITMKLPGHESQPIDTPPLELTSFQIRLDGQDVVPTALAVKGDSLYVAFAEVAAIQIYGSDLRLLKTIRLDRPRSVVPSAIAVTDSLLIVADSAAHQVLLYDREGDFLTFIEWYPGKNQRLSPAALSSNGRLLAVLDDSLNQIAMISLIDEQPFYTWLELLAVVPADSTSRLIQPRFALIAPDDNLWVGEIDRIRLFSPEGKALREAEPPPRTRIVRPIDAAIAPNLADSTLTRIHVVDRVAGKVFAYDTAGDLRLVYPRDRALQRPSAITVDAIRRVIYLTENETASITAFGY
jgi:hypothetical protein